MSSKTSMSLDYRLCTNNSNLQVDTKCILQTVELDWKVSLHTITVSIKFILSQERSSEVERLSYQLKDSVSRKESENYESALKRHRIESEQQITEGKKRLDAAKRDIYQKDLEIEKLRVELQNSVRNKMTSLEGEWRRKEGELKLALEELLLALPKMNIVDMKL